MFQVLNENKNSVIASPSKSEDYALLVFLQETNVYNASEADISHFSLHKGVKPWILSSDSTFLRFSRTATIF